MAESWQFEGFPNVLGHPDAYLFGGGCGPFGGSAGAVVLGGGGHGGAFLGKQWLLDAGVKQGCLRGFGDIVFWWVTGGKL